MKQLFRAANVSRKEAVDSILEGYEGYDLISLETKEASAEEAELAQVEEGDLVFVATVKQAEFPPAGGEEKEEKSEPANDGPPSPPKSDGGEEKSEDSDSDDKPSPPKSDGESDDSKGEDGPPKHDGPEGAAPEKMKPEEEMVHLLRQILDALGGGKGPHAEPDGDELGLGPDIDAAAEIGAPDKGDMIGPGAGGPAKPKAPLPPPVPEPMAPKRAPAAFAHYNPEPDTFYVVRKNSTGVPNQELLKEAAEIYPTHKVAKIQRTGQAEIEGETLNLPELGLAVFTLTKK